MRERGFQESKACLITENIILVTENVNFFFLFQVLHDQLKKINLKEKEHQVYSWIVPFPQAIVIKYYVKYYLAISFSSQLLLQVRKPSGLLIGFMEVYL